MLYCTTGTITTSASNGFEPLGAGKLQKSCRTWSHTTGAQNFASTYSGCEDNNLRSQAYCQNEVVMQLYAL